MKVEVIDVGRSGGGGGGRSGGGGGGRSGGGRSSFGGRSGSSSFGGHSSSNYHDHHNHHRHHGGVGYSTLGIGVFAIVTLFMVFSFMVPIIGSVSGEGPGSITKSTVDREPLAAGSVNETEYYSDELGWVQNKTKFLSGLKHFYEETGVQPYVYITGELNGTARPGNRAMKEFADELYSKLFTDEAHLLLLFIDGYDENGQGGYSDYYIAGSQAKQVIDDEAGDILLDYIDRYYYEADTEDELFSDAFEDAGNRIMEKTPNYTMRIIGGVIVVVILIAAVFVIKGIRKNNKEKAEQTQKLLDTPIEEIKSGMDDLEAKYK